MRLQNEFSWSFSRAKTFETCQKKYWYTYYGSWEGWPKTPWDVRPSIDPLAAHLYMLKQMQSIAQFVGTTVHSTIEYYIKRGQLFAREELISYAEKLFDTGLEDAKQKLWQKRPKKHLNLFEYYFDSTLSQEAITAAKEKVALCLDNWFSSPIVQQLIFSKKGQVLGVEELSFFMLGGQYKCIVVIDFAIRWQNEVIILFDWKSGEESEKTIEQLYCYALYATKTWGAPTDKIILSPFYLHKNSYKKIGYQQEEPLSLEKLHEVENTIRTSCERLSTLHRTDPKPDPTLFSHTQERTHCSSCAFKGVCVASQYENLSEEGLRLLV